MASSRSTCCCRWRPSEPARAVRRASTSASTCRGQSAQLAYLDPPFGIGTSFGARAADGTGGKGGRGGERWRAQGAVAYSDRWPSIEAYLEWLEPRIAAVRECLAPDGTLWLHLNHRAVHESKGVCDRVFGSGAFLGEVIWSPGNGARGARRGPGRRTRRCSSMRPGATSSGTRVTRACASRSPRRACRCTSRGKTGRAACIASARSPGGRTATTRTRAGRSAASGPIAPR